MKIETLKVEILTNQPGECVATAHIEGLEHTFDIARWIEFSTLLMKNMYDYLWIYGIQIHQIFVWRFSDDVLGLQPVGGKMFRVVAQNDFGPAFDSSSDDMPVFRFISHGWNKLLVAIGHPGICKMHTQFSNQIVSVLL